MSPSAQETYLDARIKDYLKVLRKHRWIITTIFLLAVLSTAILTFTMTPIYRASATIQIEPEPPRVVNIQEVTGTGYKDEDYFGTQHKLIVSHAVMRAVIEKLNLIQRIPWLVSDNKNPIETLATMIIVEPFKKTRLVYVRFDSPDPVLAAEIANAVASEYVRYNLDLKVKATREALAWLNNQTAGLRNRVQESSVALQNYRVKSNLLGLEEQRRITAQKIIDFNKAYLDAQAQRLSVEAKLREVTRIVKDGGAGVESILSVANDPLISKLKTEISDLQIQRSKLIQIYKEKHPEVAKVDAQIQQATQRLSLELRKLLQAIETEYKVAKAREETLLTNVNELRREGQALNEKEIGYLALQREADSNQQLYEAILKRVKETGIASGLDTNNATVIEAATPPAIPIRPRKALNMAASVVIGLVLGIGLAFVLESFDSSLRTPEDVERALGLPVLGIVPIYGVKR